MNVINLSILPPVMSQEQFATFTGVSKDTVRGWVENRTIPVVKIGRQQFINLKLLSGELTEKTIFVRGDYDQ